MESRGPTSGKQAPPTHARGSAASFADWVLNSSRRTAPRPVDHVMQITLDQAANPHDMIGFFARGKAGRPAFGQIIWANPSADIAGETVEIDLDGVSASDIGLFVMSGASDGGRLSDGASLHFEYDTANQPLAVCDGRRLNVSLALADGGFDDLPEDGGIRHIALDWPDGRAASLTVRTMPLSTASPQ